MITAMMIAGLMSATGSHTHHDWVRLPGPQKLLVDMASVEPMTKELFQGRPPAGVQPPAPTPYERTSATIKLNGHIEEHLEFICSGIRVVGGLTVLAPQLHPNEQSSKVIGHIPEGIVEALICPEARRMRASRP